LKKCPRCDSISSDSESFCGVCGGSLSDAVSGSLESFVHKETEVGPSRKLNLGALGLLALALSIIGGGTALLLVQNGFGLVLLTVGLLLTLLTVGGASVGMGVKAGQRIPGKRDMRRAEIEEEEKKRKRRTGEDD
jgi:hypothetical protein